MHKISPLRALLMLVLFRSVFWQFLVLELLVLCGPLGLGDDPAVREDRTQLPGVLGVGNLVAARRLMDDARPRGYDGATALAGTEHLSQVRVTAFHRRQEFLKKGTFLNQGSENFL